MGKTFIILDLNKISAFFLVLNTDGVTLLPTTVMAIRHSYGSINPVDFLPYAIIGTICSCIGGLILDYLFRKLRKNKN